MGTVGGGGATTDAGFAAAAGAPGGRGTAPGAPIGRGTAPGAPMGRGTAGGPATRGGAGGAAAGGRGVPPAGVTEGCTAVEGPGRGGANNGEMPAGCVTSSMRGGGASGAATTCRGGTTKGWVLVSMRGGGSGAMVGIDGAIGASGTVGSLALENCGVIGGGARWGDAAGGLGACPGRGVPCAGGGGLGAAPAGGTVIFGGPGTPAFGGGAVTWGMVTLVRPGVSGVTGEIRGNPGGGGPGGLPELSGGVAMVSARRRADRDGWRA